MSTSHNCSSKGSLSKGCLAIFLLNGNRSDRSELQEEATLWRELRIHKSGQMFDWRQVWRHHFPGTLKLQSKVLDDDVFIPRSIQSAHISGLSLRLPFQICPRKRDNVVCQILFGFLPWVPFSCQDRCRQCRPLSALQFCPSKNSISSSQIDEMALILVQCLSC